MNKYFLQTLFSPYVKKSLFGKQYIHFNDFHNQSYVLSQHCLMLGYTYKEQLADFMKLITDSEAGINKAIQGLERMGGSVKDGINSETESSYDLFINSQHKKYIGLLNIKKKVKNENDPLLFLERKDKLPIPAIIPLIDMLSYSFIGFGFKYPELTERFLNHKTDNDFIDLAIESGLNISKENLNVSINEKIYLAKELIKPYVTKNKPDLLKNLELE